jgi:hypothetical protein
MGEAKRRRQLDPNYGKIHRLSNDAVKTQQAELVIKELFTYFSVELKTLMIATSFPNNYLEFTERVKRWLTLRLSRYTPQDRSCIAQFIFALITNLEDGIITDSYDREHPVSPLIICCFLRVTKNYNDRIYSFTTNRKIVLKNRSRITDNRETYI